LSGKIDGIYPIISDFNQNAGVQSGHYFHQDLLIAQLIYEAHPYRHIDVGSRIDGFVAHVASFRKIEVWDIRELPKSTHTNINFYQADLMNDVEESIADSVSCLHALEHFGLGRYNDKIDPDGHIKGLQNLNRMLKPGGKLYLSFPIGTSDQVLFNAHRIFHPKSVLDWAPAELVLERFDYVDDLGDLFLNVAVEDLSVEMQYGCGIYTFKKMIKA
jgi:SAM-dependent methyltransferase